MVRQLKAEPIDSFTPDVQERITDMFNAMVDALNREEAKNSGLDPAEVASAIALLIMQLDTQYPDTMIRARIMVGLPQVNAN